MAQSSGSVFNTRMITIAAGISGKLEEALHAFAMTAYDNLQFATPIDTGQAKSNWRVGVGALLDEFFPLGDYNKRKGKHTPDVASVEATAALSHAAIAGWNGDETLFIANSSPYIQYLNDGSSVQAPAGFVEFALASAFNELRQLRIIG